jgi:RNA polymerase sigma factor for flagellar operon FliA
MTDEQQLWRRWLSTRETDAPDLASRKALIEGNLPLVDKVARGFKGVRPCDLPDLVGAGHLGLIRAVDTWNPSQMEWERFAGHKIRFAIVDHVRSQTWCPRAVRDQAEAIDTKEEELIAELGRPPSHDELAAGLGLPDGDALSSLQSKLRGTSWKIATIDARTDTDGEDLGSWAEAVPDPKAPNPLEALVASEHSGAINGILERLPNRLATVLRWKVMNGGKQTDLAKRLGLHDSRVCQLRDQAIAAARELAYQRVLEIAEAA